MENTMTPTTYDPTLRTIEVRTYERFIIRWTAGGSLSSFVTRAEAESALASWGRPGRIERITWDVKVDPRFAHIYRPGCASRGEVRVG